jgi:hypothetical protein
VTDRDDLETRAGFRLDACIVFAVSAALVFPLFRLNYLDRWGSIESTFIADARLFKENWAHHLWQPAWYLGTRTDYVYPPGLRYGPAILAWLAHASIPHAYHILTALCYAFGIAAIYMFVRQTTGSRAAAWLAAAGVALLSPSFLLGPDLRRDSPFVPWRLHALMTYGEGPHISSIAFLPMVWLGAWRRFHGGSVRWLLLSACSAAVVVSFNFYGATSLAITFPILMWACLLEQRDWRILRDSVWIAAIAYGLCAWWLAPSYLRITIRNLALVAPPTRPSSAWLLATLVILYIAATLAIRSRTVIAAYPLFTWTGLLFLTLYSFGSRWFGFHVAGDSDRLFPEWDLFAILCGVTLATGVLNWRPPKRLRFLPGTCFAVILMPCFPPAAQYLQNAYVEFRADRSWQSRVEYRTQDWLRRNYPGQRVYVTGTIRLWYNAWGDGLQADGGSMQGILNPVIPTGTYRIAHDPDGSTALHWLQALGVDIVVVPGPLSQEPFKEFVSPALFDKQFPLLYDDGTGNRFYRVPRREQGMVRIVDRGRVLAAPPVPKEYEAVQLAAYVDAIEAVPPGGGVQNRARAHWRGTDELEIRAEAQPGEALLVQETYDPYWRAYIEGRLQSIRRDALGLMVLDLPPGDHSIRMVFETPLEDYVGRVLSCITVILIAFLWLREQRQRNTAAGIKRF